LTTSRAALESSEVLRLEDEDPPELSESVSAAPGGVEDRCQSESQSGVHLRVTGFLDLEPDHPSEGVVVAAAPRRALEGPEGEGVGATVPDFSLVDLNPSSTTYMLAVSPRDFLSQASLWYFGHST